MKNYLMKIKKIAKGSYKNEDLDPSIQMLLDQLQILITILLHFVQKIANKIITPYKVEGFSSNDGTK